ncbi:MAG TPA: hypothetical protein DCM28_01480 [Phycisphaerales bacterium]|nr:hypothetical protein [Phycisphaerales bacterium]
MRFESHQQANHETGRIKQRITSGRNMTETLPPYPITVYAAAWNERGPNYKVTAHFRSDVQWYGVQYGRAEMTVQDKVYTLNPGESLIIPPGAMRSPCCASSRKSGIGYFWVNFENHRLQLDACYDRVLSLGSALKQDMATLIDELQSPGQHDANDLILSLTTRLLIGLARDHSPQTTSSPSHPPHPQHEARIEQLDAFMRSNLHRSLTRDDLGKVVALSPAHLARVYRHATGQTLAERLTELRLERAKQLLISSSLPITHIALEIGFNSSSHFSHMFLKHVGVNPLAYRQAKGRVWRHDHPD